jgi:hypothetical protein
VEDHLYPTPSFIAERYKFSQRNQLENEGMAQYIATLKRLSTHCNFGAQLNDFLRDRLVSGIRSESAKQKLLSESNLTYETAVKILTALETTEKAATTLATGGLQQKFQLMSMREHRRYGPQHSGDEGREGSRKQLKSSVQCQCCGKYGHYCAECRYRNYECYYCLRKGHLQQVCRKKKGKGNSITKYNVYKKRNPVPKANERVTVKSNFYVDVEEERNDCSNVVNDEGEVYDISCLFTLGKEGRIKVDPIRSEVIVNGQRVIFEVDSGAAVSVISKRCYQDKFNRVTLKPTDVMLSSYTGQRIKPLGVMKVKADLKGITRNLDLYVVNNGAHPILGRDWMKALRVQIYVSEKIQGIDLQCSESAINYSKIIKQIIGEYPEVFKDRIGTYKGEPVKLRLKPNAIPKFCKPRPLPFSLKLKVEKELEKLTKENIITPVSSSDWGTPIVPVPKLNGSIRLCGDFKITVNPNLEIDRYPIPRIEDLFATLQKGETFTKIDLSQAYLQCPLDNESRKMCTISTHKGLFMYNRIPYGIASAPSIFQRIMEQTLQGLPGVIVFLDDILVTGSNHTEHLARLREVCKRLKEKGLTVSQEKCTFFADNVEYLGFVIDKKGLHTSDSKVKAIRDAPVPRNVSQLKAFLGLINYYGKFIPNLATILHPMYNLLRKDVRYKFDRKCLNAFNVAKQKLISSPVLAHYNPELPLKLSCDASSYGLGSVLSIKQPDGTECPIAYASRTLSKAEQNYSQIDKEALSLVFGVKRFNQYLWGKHFTLVTDHKPLTSIFGPKRGLPVFAASRLQRYALFLSGYSFDILYAKAENHKNADALSRLPLQVTVCDDEKQITGTYLHYIRESEVPINFEDVKRETQKDPILKKLYCHVKYGWPNVNGNDELLPYFRRKEDLTIEQGILMWGCRVVVPTQLRPQLLKELHESHLGVVKMKSTARSYIWWPEIDKDIETLANTCSSCLQERSNPMKTYLHPWNYPNKPWERIHVDYLGPFRGKLYLIVIDAHSKWLEVLSVSSTSANHCINHLRELFARYGIPVHIVSDNGPPFTSSEFKHFLMMNGIKHTLSPPYHPQTNGQAENSVRFVKTKLKQALRDNLDSSIALNNILFNYRNSVHSTTGETPAMLMYRRPLRTRLDLLKPNLSQVVQHKQNQQIQNSKGSKLRILQPGIPVLIRDYRTPNKWVEGMVLKRINVVTYLVKLHSGIIWKRHIDQLIQLDTLDTTNGHECFRDFNIHLPEQPLATRTEGEASESYENSVDTTTPTSIDTRGSTDTSHESEGKLNSPKSTEDNERNKRYPSRIRKPVVKLNL